MLVQENGGMMDDFILQGNKQKKRIRLDYGSLLIDIVLIIFLIIATNMVSSDLTCTRANPGAPVNCVERSRYLNLFQLEDQVVRNLVGARIEEYTGYDGDQFYSYFSTKLVTHSGDFKLRLRSRTNYDDQLLLSKQINDFVASENELKIEIIDQEFVQDLTIILITGLCLTLPFFMIIGLCCQSWTKRFSLLVLFFANYLPKKPDKGG